MKPSLRAYASFFRVRFQNGMQYRAAALAGMVTQFAWGFMEVMLYSSFHRSATDLFPMEFQALSAYIWLRQAFLTLFLLWQSERDLFDLISNGDVGYELCRPLDLYGMWFTKNAAGRLSKAVLRCVPVLVVAFCLPKPYGMSLPSSPAAFLLFLVAMLLGFLLTIAITMIMYIVCFYTISSAGIQMIGAALVEFLSGDLIPLPFLPDGFRQVVELLPFASTLNLPFRIYGGDIAGTDAYMGILLQAFWLLVFLLLGKWLMTRALRRVVVQGG